MDYGDIQIKSHEMENNFSTKVLHDKPGIDTAGKFYDEPIFKEGDDTYEAHEMIYNFETKRALVSQVVTEENEGILHGDSTMMDEFNNMYVKSGKMYDNIMFGGDLTISQRVKSKRCFQPWLDSLKCL